MPAKDMAAYQRAYYAANKEREDARGSARRKANPAKYAAYRRAAYKSDPEKEAARKRAYRLAKPDKQAAYNRAWREANPEKSRALVRAWAANHPEKRRISKLASNHRRRSRKLNAFVEDVDHAVVFKRDSGICGICNLSVDPTDWHLDHVVPLCKGGEHSYANVQVSHPSCNMQKGATAVPSVFDPLRSS